MTQPSHDYPNLVATIVVTPQPDPAVPVHLMIQLYEDSDRTPASGDHVEYYLPRETAISLLDQLNSSKTFEQYSA